MFNRSTKMTALLVAAASVLTTVPAMAADSKRITEQDGNITSAIAFKDGKYLYQGYLNDDDNDGLHFNSGDKKDKYLGSDEDADTIVSKFGDKFVKVTDGDGGDEYVVDLTSGKIDNDDTLEELTSEAETKLAGKLKKADKYDSLESVSIKNLTAISNNQFGEMWYSYETTSSSEAKASFGYTNAKGDYIDCSFDLNAYVFYDETTTDTTKGEMYKLNDADDTARDKTIKVKSVKRLTTLAQDSKNIYALIEVEFVMPNGDVKPHTYVQKVSKAQGSKEKDAYKPKTTECYEVGGKESYFAEKAALDNGDIRNAYDLFEKVKDANNKDGKVAYSDRAECRVVDGDLYVAFTDGDKVKVRKIKLRTSEKLDQKDTSNDKKFATVSSHIAKQDSDKDTDAKDWTFDVNGNVWAINKGDIMKSSKCEDFKTIYTCDRTIDHLDVYDENNLIAWNDDVYVTVGGKATTVVDEPIVETPAVVADGWKQDTTTGSWSYYENGAKVTGWKYVGNEWYHMDANGIMQTGWIQDAGTWYFLNTNSDGTMGAMQTGWKYDPSYGAWFYLNPVSDGTRGAMKTGWYKDTTGTWYFSYDNGVMAANTTTPDGYVVDASGAWIG